MRFFIQGSSNVILCAGTSSCVEIAAFQFVRRTYYLETYKWTLSRNLNENGFKQLLADLESYGYKEIK